ncbi:MAG: tRNA epoxyqueuosine(34) reductase QueG [Bacteroidota bacterium]
MIKYSRDYKDRIKNKALELGFDDCGFSKAGYLKEDAGKLREWLKKGYNGSMKYMEKYFDKRVNPGKLVPGYKSVISVIMNYYPPEEQPEDTYKISKYAYGRDYHKVLKRRLHLLLDFIDKEIAAVDGRVFVDSAPVLDKAWAVKAGLGWIGKNSMFISPRHGSFVFIGEIISNLEVDVEANEDNDMCGSCTRCVWACPTGAITEPRVIDASRCISYQTIENKGEIPLQHMGRFNDYIFGCDICQDVCPWNKKVKITAIRDFHPPRHVLEMGRKDWENMEFNEFLKLYGNSPVKRAGFKKLKENMEFARL